MKGVTSHTIREVCSYMYLPRTSELPLVLGPNSIGEKRQPLTPLPAVFGRLPRPSLSTEGAGVKRLLAPGAKWKWGGSLAGVTSCSRLVSWALGCCMLISAPTDLLRRRYLKCWSCGESGKNADHVVVQR